MQVKEEERLRAASPASPSGFTAATSRTDDWLDPVTPEAHQSLRVEFPNLIQTLSSPSIPFHASSLFTMPINIQLV